MPAIKPRRWTRPEVLALIEANPLHSPRYELVDGELLVSPSPGYLHQKSVREFSLILCDYTERTGIGDTLWSPFDIELDPDSLLQPDIFVLPHSEVDRVRHVMPAKTVLLTVEVLSPSTAWYDHSTKRAVYQRNAPKYWIVDADKRHVERWTPASTEAEIVRGTLTWQPSAEHDPLAIDLPRLFAKIHGDV